MIEKILEKIEAESFTTHTKEYGSLEVISLEAVSEIVQEVAKEYDGGWIPLEKGVLPDECEEVDVTIEDDDGDVYTSTSWLQDGVWVVKKTALHPRVIAWKPKSAPYQRGEQKQYCSTCHWYALEEGVCVNGDSEHRADFRCLDDSCKEWKQKGE